jgi:hypothetical protein
MTAPTLEQFAAMDRSQLIRSYCAKELDASLVRDPRAPSMVSNLSVAHLLSIAALCPQDRTSTNALICAMLADPRIEASDAGLRIVGWAKVLEDPQLITLATQAFERLAIAEYPSTHFDAACLAINVHIRCNLSPQEAEACAPLQRVHVALRAGNIPAAVEEYRHLFQWLIKLANAQAA